MSNLLLEVARGQASLLRSWEQTTDIESWEPRRESRDDLVDWSLLEHGELHLGGDRDVVRGPVPVALHRLRVVVSRSLDDANIANELVKLQKEHEEHVTHQYGRLCRRRLEPGLLFHSAMSLQ